MYLLGGQFDPVTLSVLWLTFQAKVSHKTPCCEYMSSKPFNFLDITP